jgi:hypothetical protein
MLGKSLTMEENDLERILLELKKSLKTSGRRDDDNVIQGIWTL